MMSTIRAYTVSDAENYVPDDVTEALGLPAHVHQARLLVFAQSRETAWRRLKSLSLTPRGTGWIQLTTGDDVDVLAGRGLDYMDATYAINESDGTVVEILTAQRQPAVTMMNKDRHLIVIGKLCWTHGKLHWHASETIDIVSDKMVRAALEIVDGPYIKTDFEDMRLAIYAALQAREK
jgi:hypothetical protein